MDNTCVVCGDVIPEGRQVCSVCANAVPRSMASEPQREPLWCENCAHFCNADMGGEGECAVDHLPTWYGNSPCHRFERKEGKQNNFDRIRNMSVEEMAELLSYCVETGACNDFGIEPIGKCDGNCKKCIKQWLESDGASLLMTLLESPKGE